MVAFDNGDSAVTHDTAATVTTYLLELVVFSRAMYVYSMVYWYVATSYLLSVVFCFIVVVVV